MPRLIVGKVLSGKKVITNDGEDFGRVIDITFDERSGKLEDLLVEVNESLPYVERLRKNEEGYVLVPFNAVVALSDYLIIDKSQLLM
jgi:sporulation protein YlmC with PRC-barrel domain